MRLLLLRLLSALTAFFSRTGEQAQPLPPDSHLPTTVDKGQHEPWKRLMRIAVWRFLRGHLDAGYVDLRDLGIRPRTASEADSRQAVRALFPLEPDLCAASRRLGFKRLVMAAASGLAVSDDDVADMWLAHESATDAYAVEAHRRNTETAATWNEAMGPFIYDTVDITRSIFSLGAVNGPSEYPPEALAALSPFAPVE